VKETTVTTQAKIDDDITRRASNGAITVKQERHEPRVVVEGARFTLTLPRSEMRELMGALNQFFAGCCGRHEADASAPQA
jgi:hypothetical protein